MDKGAAAAALVLALAACTSSTPASAPSSPAVQSPPHASSGPTLEGRACTAAHLKLGRGGQVSEATGQESRLLTLTNTSSAPCHLEGYPQIVLIDATGKPIPFHYRDGGDQMVTSRLPTLVRLAPGKAAFLMINKYRCDLGDQTRAVSLKVTPPGDASTLSVSLGVYPILAYCGPGDPGSVVDISPIEPTSQSALAH